MQDTLPSANETPTNLTLREYGDILRRRRAIILQTFVIVLVIGILVNLYTPLTYSASARLLTEAPRFAINTVNTSDPLSDIFNVGQQYSLMTQVQMMQRPEMQAKVSEKLGVKGLPAFNIRPVEGTQIIEATAEGESSEVVASALNTLMETYQADVAANSNKRLEKALALATDKSKIAADKIEDLQRKSNTFKRQYSLYEVTANKEEYLSRVRDLSDQYQTALSEMKGIQGRIAATNNALRAQLPTLLPFINRAGDPRIQTTEEKIAEFETAKLALKEGQGFDVDSPQMQQFDVQIKQMRQRQKELLRSYVQRNAIPNPQFKLYADQIAAQNIELVSIQTKTNDIQRRLNDAKRRLANFPDWEREWSSLQGQLAKAQRDYEYFSTQLNTLQLRSEATKGGGPVILQRAVPPSKPIRPNREQNILFAGLLGIFFGLCLALLQELFDDRINTPEESERVLHLPSLGLIPLIEEEGLRLIKDTTSRFSPLMESYRSLRTNINFAAVGHPVRSLVVTSSVPAEGKSTTVANLAMAMAMEKKRVIIVDADLRRPSLHKLFKVDTSPGLTDVLVGTHSIEEVLRPIPVGNNETVYLIPAGSPPPNPAELLGSTEMGRFMSALETKCDIALFDSPPALLVADGVVLASRANGVVLVIGFGETKKTNTRKAIETLSRANANILGTVLNRMEGQTSGYYYGKYYVPVSDRVRTENGTSASGSNGTIALPAGDEERDGALTASRTEVSRYSGDASSEEENEKK